MSTDTIHEITTLVASRNPLLVLDSVEEDRVRGMVDSVGAQLQLPVFEWSITEGMRRSDNLDRPNGMTTEPVKMFYHLREIAVRSIFMAHDLAVHLKDPIAERVLRETLPLLSLQGSTLMITGMDVGLPPTLEADAVRIDVAMPGRDELSAMLDAMVSSTGATVAPGAADAALDAVQGLTVNQARQAVAEALINGSLELEDAKHLMDRKVTDISEGGLLEYFPAEDNQAQLEGIDNLKSWLQRAAIADTPAARDLNIPPPRGILLAGVPGCGKSLAARYVARLWNRPLLKLDAGVLYDKYIGETERNLRAALDMAESLAPIVLWIDEIEKGLSTGGTDEGGAVGKRMLGTFLTWLQEQRKDIFVIATSNDLTALPPELQRKGRFDEVFFIDLPTATERAAIFSGQLSFRKQQPAQFDLAGLAAASDGFSGAEIEQVVVAGILRALQAQRQPDTAAILEELKATVPLSRSRPEAIAATRARASDFVPASAPAAG